MSCSRPAAAGQRAVEAHFLGQHAGQKGHFDRMPQHVLAVAGAEPQPAEQVNDLGMQAGHVGFLGRFFAVLLDVLLHFGLRLGDDLFDPGRMDAAVGDQLVERHAADFAAHRIEPADDHHARRVVDDHVDAGGLFEGPDVAPFAADDPALHLVAGNVDGAGGGFGGVGGGVALDAGDQHLAALGLADFGHFLLVPQDHRALLVRQSRHRADPAGAWWPPRGSAR